MRTIKDMLKVSDNEKVYVYCKDKETETRFLEDAQKEGFRFGDILPTASHPAQIIAIEGMDQLAHVGSVGHMAFQAGACTRIDYAKYIADEDDFIYR